jgi:hypothetical protein
LLLSACGERQITARIKNNWIICGVNNKILRRWWGKLLTLCVDDLVLMEIIIVISWHVSKEKLKRENFIILLHPQWKAFQTLLLKCSKDVEVNKVLSLIKGNFMIVWECLGSNVIFDFKYLNFLQKSAKNIWKRNRENSCDKIYRWPPNFE